MLIRVIYFILITQSNCKDCKFELPLVRLHILKQVRIIYFILITHSSCLIHIIKRNTFSEIKVRTEWALSLLTQTFCTFIITRVKCNIFSSSTVELVYGQGAFH